MDQITLEYYNNNFEELQDKYSSSYPAYINWFHNIYNKDSTILDIGSASGRDLNILLNLNFDAYGLELSKGFIQSSINFYPNLKDRVKHGYLPNCIPVEYEKIKWDSILLAAVLQHIPNSKLLDSIIKIHSMLKTSGFLLLSIPTKYPQIDNRDKNGRLFNIRSKDEYLVILESVGFTLIKESITDDVLNRDGVEWTTMLLKKM